MFAHKHLQTVSGRHSVLDTVCQTVSNTERHAERRRTFGANFWGELSVLTMLCGEEAAKQTGQSIGSWQFAAQNQLRSHKSTRRTVASSLLLHSVAHSRPQAVSGAPARPQRQLLGGGLVAEAIARDWLYIVETGSGRGGGAPFRVDNAFKSNEAKHKQDHRHSRRSAARRVRKLASH